MDIIIEDNTMIINGKKINFNNKINKILEFPNYCIILLMDDNVPENNVEAYDYNGNSIWNISQIINLKYSESYISLSRESETLFSVVSYNGVKFVVDVNTLQTINKNITK